MAKTDDSSNYKPKKITDLKKEPTLNQLKKKVAELEKVNSAQYKTIEKALSEIEKKEEKIQSLEKMLQQNVPVKKDFGQLQISDEELIAHVELARLKEKAITGVLTHEDIKKYDILVRTKNSLVDNNERDITISALPPGTSEEELLKLADVTEMVDSNE